MDMKRQPDRDAGAGPVGSYSSNGYGLHDMSGNAWEWVSSKYKGYPYHVGDSKENIDNSGDNRVLRGGSWDNASVSVRCANRLINHPRLRGSLIGFRCAR